MGTNDTDNANTNVFSSSDYTDWKTQYDRLKTEYDILKAEKEQIEQDLNVYKGSSARPLPSKEEVESISAMLDLVNKLDDATLTRIEKLNRKGRCR